ncbi:MAG: hypothetical protein ABSD38_09480 [Syntrophorhabdales bacterium]|jgi:hypothetical protein
MDSLLMCFQRETEATDVEPLSARAGTRAYNERVGECEAAAAKAYG